MSQSESRSEVSYHVVSVDRARDFIDAALQAQGLGKFYSQVVADNLVESELLGHRTHGLAKLGQYMEMLKNGDIAVVGEIETIADHGPSFAWNAHRLPGAWVLKLCIEQVLERTASAPVVTATIANCSHVGSLQTYLEAIAHRGLIGMIMASDPGVATVAPFGAIDGVLGPNPIAMCFPTDADPIWIDQCTSTVSNSEVKLAFAAGEPMRGMWLLDGAGVATDDPSALALGASPRGTIMPLGGAELGHKGFGFGLMVEALALALSGYGRSGPSKRAGGQGVFVQVLNPAFFSGAAAFEGEVAALTSKIRAARPIPGRPAPRLPGTRAQAMRTQQHREGLRIEQRTFIQIGRMAAQLGISPLVEEPA